MQVNSEATTSNLGVLNGVFVTYNNEKCLAPILTLLVGRTRVNVADGWSEGDAFIVDFEAAIDAWSIDLVVVFCQWLGSSPVVEGTLGFITDSATYETPD